MQVCTSLQTDNHASNPTLSFFTGRTPFLPPNQQRQITDGSRQKALNSHLEKNAQSKWPWRSLEVIRIAAVQYAMPITSYWWSVVTINVLHRFLSGKLRSYFPIFKNASRHLTPTAPMSEHFAIHEQPSYTTHSVKALKAYTFIYYTRIILSIRRETTV